MAPGATMEPAYGMANKYITMLKLPLKNNSAILLHSGGQDSTTCLMWALKKFDEVILISFDYGQRHKVEITAARKIAKKLNLKHEVDRKSVV